MAARRPTNARFAAGVFLALVGARLPAAPLRIAAERPGDGCPDGPGLSLVRVEPAAREGGPGGRCLALLPVRDLSDGPLDGAVAAAARRPGQAGVIVEFASLPETGSSEFSIRVPYAIKKLASAIRAASPDAEVAFDLTIGAPPGGELVLAEEGLGPYADALVLRPGRGRVESSEVRERWLLAPPSAGSAAARAVRALQDGLAPPASVTVVGLLGTPDRPADASEWKALERLQAYFTRDVSFDPTPTTVAHADGTASPALRYFDAKAFTPVLLLSGGAGRAEIDLSGGAWAKAAVENLESGARRDFDLPKGSRSLALDLSLGPLAVRLQPAARPETRAAVEVGAARGLTVEEIVAAERVWDAGQREKVPSFIGEMKTSLRFRIADINESFDLTIVGPFFYQRGKPGDWVWRTFYLNGVLWKGATLPRIPILQPEKVTTLPLEIRLSEDYDYVLKGTTTIGRRRAYQVAFSPKASIGDKPIYRGTAWIDAETFALVKRETIQLNLKGENLSNVQTEYYRSLPGRPDVVLPVLIRGEQVFSTVGRTTNIERDVQITDVQIDPADFEARRAEAYASERQMVRDTDKGLRFLVPDPGQPGNRIVEEKISKKSVFGLVGTFYDPSVGYPVPLIGAQYFNFDMWGKEKQLSVFFGGAVLTGNYTDPALAGTRIDLGADVFATAIPFSDSSYRNGHEVKNEKIKDLPAEIDVHAGYPLGPYLKTSFSLLTKWNDYQRDSDTGPNFVTPVDTLTLGGEGKLTANYEGFVATASLDYFHRLKWAPWGDPATSDYDPSQQNYWKWAFSLAKDQYFSGFRKLHVQISYMDGDRLDRFSKYEFGPFSGIAAHGFKSGSLRTERAVLATVSYGLNIENIIRFEGYYDQILAWDKVSGYNGTYFSGAGLLASLNGPLKNSILRAEIGVPVVRHGVNGFTISALLLKLF
jgi:hypothetical protein